MRIGPMARPDDGLPEVILFERVSKPHLIARLHTISTERHVLERGGSHFACRWLSLEALAPVRSDGTLALARRTVGPETDRAGPDPVVANPASTTAPYEADRLALDLDGDALGDIPLEAGVLPRALRVCVPATR